MIGRQVTHWSGEAGTIDATVTHPDDRVLVRINDHWFFADDVQVA